MTATQVQTRESVLTLSRSRSKGITELFISLIGRPYYVDIPLHANHGSPDYCQHTFLAYSLSFCNKGLVFCGKWDDERDVAVLGDYEIILASETSDRMWLKVELFEANELPGLLRAK